LVSLYNPFLLKNCILTAARSHLSYYSPALTTFLGPLFRTSWYPKQPLLA
jgi:hypothetical protein